jgi:hypothetical protein
MTATLTPLCEAASRFAGPAFGWPAACGLVAAPRGDGTSRGTALWEVTP